jgi:hypothetical protein
MDRTLSVHIEDEKVRHFFREKKVKRRYYYKNTGVAIVIILKLILPVLYEDAK